MFKFTYLYSTYPYHRVKFKCLTLENYLSDLENRNVKIVIRIYSLIIYNLIRRVSFNNWNSKAIIVLVHKRKWIKMFELWKIKYRINNRENYLKKNVYITYSITIFTSRNTACSWCKNNHPVYRDKCGIYYIQAVGTIIYRQKLGLGF